jgi:chemotaxis protein MotB
VSSQNAALSGQVDVLLARAESAEGKLESAEDTVTADRGSIRAQLSQIESLRRDIEALRRVRVNLELQVAGLINSLDESEQTLAAAQDETQGLQSALDTAEADSAAVQARLDAASTESAQALAALAELETTARSLREQSAEFEAGLTASRSALGALRDRTKELEARLATEAERTLLAQKDIEDRDIRLAELQALYLTRDSDLETQRTLATRASDHVQALNRQVEALRQQLRALQQALNIAEERDEEQQIVISSLGERLNRALAARVEELSRYRSEFFGRLREVLGDRQDIQIVGDRFVFQSEVLFTSGSAELEEGGKLRLAELAQTLLEISPKIPAEIPWILRVDGHTDAVPIHTAQFPSNWELSSARAISVIQFLMEEGIPAGRLAAAGFGQFQPLDGGFDEIANRRNRRIELKLTER